MALNISCSRLSTHRFSSQSSSSPKSEQNLRFLLSNSHLVVTSNSRPSFLRKSRRTFRVMGSSTSSSQNPDNNVQETSRGDYYSVSDAEWKKRLTSEQFYITRQKGTERAFTGDFATIHEYQNKNVKQSIFFFLTQCYCLSERHILLRAVAYDHHLSNTETGSPKFKYGMSRIKSLTT
ncbi:hypothetical protein MKX01_019949 [Papaver californicum]|nr:hypothetical protein MKX01_019949 [Papaver californicum]